MSGVNLPINGGWNRSNFQVVETDWKLATNNCLYIAIFKAHAIGNWGESEKETEEFNVG